MAYYIDLQTWDGNLDDFETWGVESLNSFALGSLQLDLQGRLDLQSNVGFFGEEGEFTLDPPAELHLQAVLGISGTITIPAGDPTIVFLGPATLRLRAIVGLAGSVHQAGGAFWQPEPQDETEVWEEPEALVYE